jgi:hypothetical protein
VRVRLDREEGGGVGWLTGKWGDASGRGGDWLEEWEVVLLGRRVVGGFLIVVDGRVLGIVVCVPPPLPPHTQKSEQQGDGTHG